MREKHVQCLQKIFLLCLYENLNLQTSQPEQACSSHVEEVIVQEPSLSVVLERLDTSSATGPFSSDALELLCGVTLYLLLSSFRDLRPVKFSLNRKAKSLVDYLQVEPVGLL